MSTVRIKIQDPFSRDYVVMDMPRDMKLADMQTVSDIATRTAIELSGSKEIPSCYAKFPINNVGRVALVLIAQTMPGRLADAVEGEMLMGMISATRFLRQLLDRVGTNVMMSKKLYAQSVVEFCAKSNPFFIDALRMRLPTLVQQACEAVPADINRAKRLSKLAEIAIKTLDELPSLMGKIVYTKWISGNAPSILPEPATTAAAATAAETQVVEAQNDEKEDVPVPTPPQPALEEKYGSVVKEEDKKDEKSSVDDEEEEKEIKPKPKRTRRTPVTRRISSPKRKPPAKEEKEEEEESEEEEEEDEKEPEDYSSESEASEPAESDYGTPSSSEDEEEDEDEKDQ